MDIEVRTGVDVRKAIAAKAAAKKEVQDKVLRLEKAMQEDQPRRGGCLAWLFRPRSRQPSAALDQAVFGHKSTASSSASDRLNTAARSMEAKAKALMASGKKPEALAWLKKAKQAESQHSNAVATHAALERQIDVLAESALQKEVATALSASVAVAKKKTVGLLSKTEDAVDLAVELKDFAEDVSQAFGGLQTDNYDDDELLEELQAMSMEEEIEESMEAPEPVVAVPVVDPGAYPVAPSAKKLERKSLLADDGAAEAHAESL
jgi:hypothetical protein